MNEQNTAIEDKKLRAAVERYNELKRKRVRGSVRIYTDGSGTTREFAVEEHG
jgi:hypothetical protein